jgi:PEP-CTERM/exosortase A-associated glycosyltransferase
MRKRLPVLYELKLVSALGRRIREVARACAPDVIHAHSPILNGMAALRAGKRLGIPVVYEIRAFWEDAAVDHGTYGEGSVKYRVVRALESRVCRQSGHVTVICDGLRQDLVRRGIPAEKISIVPNGIAVEEFRECGPDRELAVSWKLDGKSVIGFLGSFYRYEGLDLAVDAFASLAGKHRDWVLLLVGGGEMDAGLKEKVRSLGLGDSVIFPGRIPHERIPGIYALSDILIYPRYSMRLTDLVTPLKPLEAMAMGKAVIASDVGGHKELIRNGETGILFPAGSAPALASAMERLLLEKESRMAMAERARAWVRRERPWERTTAPYEEIYSRLLKASPRIARI